LLVTLSLTATLLGGLAGTPWWFWLIGAAGLTLLLATDPGRSRAGYPDVRGAGNVLLLLDDLKMLSKACLMSAAAFASGSFLSAALPH
jgi:hypothetical protein